MSEIALQFPALPGTALTFEAAAGGGNWYKNDNGRTRAWATNIGGVAVRVRVKRQRPNSDGASVDLDVNLPAGGSFVILEEDSRELNVYRYNEAGTGFVYLSYPDGAAAIQVAAEGRS